jgi:hypothetical protein
MVWAAAQNRDRLMVTAIVRDPRARQRLGRREALPDRLATLTPAGNCTRADYLRTTGGRTNVDNARPPTLRRAVRTNVENRR